MVRLKKKTKSGKHKTDRTWDLKKKKRKNKIESQKVRKIGRMQFQLFSLVLMMLGFMSAFMYVCVCVFFFFFFFFFFPGFNCKVSVAVINEACYIVVVTDVTLIKVFHIGPITRPRSILLARVRIPRAKTADREPVKNFFINDNLIILTTPLITCVITMMKAHGFVRSSFSES